ncbi:hypothetical protein ACGYDT_003590 [Vibrio cholerae]
MELVTVIATAILSSGMFAFIIKEKIKSYMSKQVESHRQSIKHDYDIKFEETKNKFQKSNLEHQVKSTYLLEKRAEVVAETYTLLRSSFNAVTRISVINNCSSEDYEQAKNKINDLIEYYPSRRIFIPHELASEIDSFRLKLSKLVDELQLENDRNNLGYRYEKIFNELSGELSDLEWSFRELIGEQI